MEPLDPAVFEGPDHERRDAWEERVAAFTDRPETRVYFQPFSLSAPESRVTG
jgi:hypothetical protein